MLKSTYKPATSSQTLPAGWTEHKAPTGAFTDGASEVRLTDLFRLCTDIESPGHSYYYHAATQQSTYTRPTSAHPQQSPPTQLIAPFNGVPSVLPSTNGFGSQHFTGPRDHRQNNRHQVHGSDGFGENASRNRSQPRDRPKSKIAIPGCEPWILVKTRLGRRFVHNTEKNESFWKFPPDVLKAVVEYDRIERERKGQNEEASVAKDGFDERVQAAEEQLEVAIGPAPLVQPARQDNPDESDEYEEVEVTDEEDDDENEAKRQKTDENATEQPLEFNEDDIAYQLAAMGQDYGLDPGEYGESKDEDVEEGAEGLPLSEEDAHALFKDMLDDFSISPYNTWERLVEEGRIIEDDRYTLLPNMKTRKEVWADWSRDRIQRLKEQREKAEKKDPRIPYLAFLQAKATPKLYWPEFRRKYMKEPEMRNTKLSDKEREKWYRDYISRLKLPESTLKSDLVSLLKSTPLSILNQSTSIDALPPAILTDIRYFALRSSIRDPLIVTHISTLPGAPENAEMDEEEQEARLRHKQDRERRKALAERQLQVQKDKKRAREALEYSKGRMREGEREIQRAMDVGKQGLLAYMEPEEHVAELPVDKSP
ncbi:MAG: hypothetical protein Q9220_000528 [cf. Caloplaca sp. 1 TL-2023]